MNNKVYIICDPVHGMMGFTKEQHHIISKIIDTPSYQRLRHVKQLSFAEFAFPGATHTRFSHCIGAAYLSTKVSHVLKLEPEIADLVLISSLLHDIGHGPLSHAFEHIYDDTFKIKHELWTKSFVQEIIEWIKDPELKRKLEISLEMMDKTSEKYKMERKIFSSQMDVDRFDYLLRDSHFCGVSYGIFDVNWLISCMEKHEDHIIISSKGISSLEHYLMARKLMTQNVCYHNRSSAASYLFVAFFKLFRKILRSDEAEINKLFGESPLINFLKIINTCQDEVNETNHNKLVNRAIKEGFEDYKKLSDHDFWSLVTYLGHLEKDKFTFETEILEQLAKISNMFLSRNLPYAFQIRTELYEDTKDKINEFKKNIINNSNLDWMLYVDDSSISFYDTNNKEDIFIAVPNSNNDAVLACDIMQDSDILPNLSNKKYKTVYLFIAKNIDKDLHNKIVDLVKTLNDEHVFVPNRKLHEFIKNKH